MTRPVDSRETFCACGQPAVPGQRLCRTCRAAYMRGWRADKGPAAQDLRKVVESLVHMASELRKLTPCPPGAGCAECDARRLRVATGEALARKLTRAWRDD